MSQERVYVWSVYRDPIDYPGKYVVRRFDITEIPPVPELVPWAIHDTLEQARASVPFGTVKLIRSPEDEPHIVETWL